MAWKKGIASHKTLAKELATAITTALDAEGLPMWELVPSMVGEFAPLVNFQGDGYVIKPTDPDFGEPLYLTIKPTYGYDSSDDTSKSMVCQFTSSTGFTPGESDSKGTHNSPITSVPVIFKRPLSSSAIVGSDYYGLDIFRYEVRILKDNIVFMVTNNEELFTRAEPFPWVGYFGKLTPLDNANYSSYALLSSANYGKGTTPGVPQLHHGNNQYEIASAKASDIPFYYDNLHSGQMLASNITYGIGDFSVGSPVDLYLIRIASTNEIKYPQICYQTINGEKYLVVKFYSNNFSYSSFDFAPSSGAYFLMLIKGVE